MKKYLICIIGPTASGKTKLGIDIATHFNSEIISADSRQFFKEMPIGTAQPSEIELNKVNHHFIANLSVQEEMNVGIFESQALQTLENLFKKNPIQVLVGGSGLYVDAVCKGFDDLPTKDPIIRASLQKDLEQKGISFLQEKLKSLDPEHFEKMDNLNPQRLMRAIEICLITGNTNAYYKKQVFTPRNFKIIKIGIDLPRELLYQRINARVDQMMEMGLLKEAQNLISFKDLGPLQTVGYKELFDYFEGKTSLEKSIDLIKQHTRNFAKRQMTWFRRDADTLWIGQKDVSEILETIAQKIKS